MRLLLLGGSGQVGREIRALAGPDLAVTVLPRAAADLAEPGAAAAALAAALGSGGTDAVVNAAAFTAVDRAEAEEALAFRVNGAAPGALARAAAAAGVPFLHVSTDYVFDGRPGRAWTEADAPAPLSAYGRSKLAGEAAVRAAGGRHAVLRTAWVFSAHGTNFVRTMLRLGAERAELRVVDDQRGGPTPAAAVAGALLVLARALAAGHPGGLWHYAGVPETSWCGFARAILAAAGLPARVVPIASADWPSPARRPANSVLDCGRIARDFGLAPPDWRAALPGVIAAIRAGG